MDLLQRFLPALSIWVAMSAVPIAIVSAVSAWKAYQRKSMLVWIWLAVCLIAFVAGSVSVRSVPKLFEPRPCENSETMWCPLAEMMVTASGQDVDVLLDELNKFAGEKGAPVQNFPKPGQSRVDMSISLGQETYFKVLNHVSPTSLPSCLLA
jgi:hypothetical protein